MRLVFASERLISNMSRRGWPRYFDYCRTELSKAGLKLEGNCKRPSWSGFAVCANAPQESAGMC
jgi:hypothetical protein